MVLHVLPEWSFPTGETFLDVLVLGDRKKSCLGFLLLASPYHSPLPETSTPLLKSSQGLWSLLISNSLLPWAADGVAKLIRQSADHPSARTSIRPMSVKSPLTLGPGNLSYGPVSVPQNSHSCLLRPPLSHTLRFGKRPSGPEGRIERQPDFQPENKQ
jgi:hypothetical protein